MAEFTKGSKSQKRKRSGRQRGKSSSDLKQNKMPRGAMKDKTDDSNFDQRGAGRTSSLNDLSWYSRNPQLLVAAGQFPFPYRPGMAAPIVAPVDATKYTAPTVPGIMVMDWAPCLGNSSSSLDPASIVGKEFYGRVRASFSGSIDADAPDFVFYLGALDSVFTYIGWLKRVYRAISSYTPDNFMLPDGLLTACGFGSGVITQLRTDKVHLWQGINELILKSRKFKCPAVMDLFNRHYWMSDNVYADADSPRAQLYLFNCAGVYKLGDVKEQSSGGTITGLVMKAIPHVPASGEKAVDMLLKFGSSLIEAIDAWDDGYLIGGYLMKAFDGVPSFTVAELLQDELITVSYVPEVLTQIENSMTCVPAGGGTRSLSDDTIFAKITVTQNVTTNAVISTTDLQCWVLTPSDFKASQKLGTINPVLSIRSDAPTVADNVIASRLHAYCTFDALSGTGAQWATAHVTCGTEIPMSWHVVKRTTNDTWETQSLYQITQLGIGPVTNGQLLFQRSVFDIGQFDWHPFVYVFVPTNTANVTTGVDSGTLAISGDTHNIAVLSPADLENLHKICTYSEFNSFGI